MEKLNESLEISRLQDLVKDQETPDVRDRRMRVHRDDLWSKLSKSSFTNSTVNNAFRFRDQKRAADEHMLLVLTDSLLDQVETLRKQIELYQSVHPSQQPSQQPGFGPVPSVFKKCN